MLTVGVDAVRVEDGLVRGELACPDCGGLLGLWGWARSRVLRDGGANGGAVVVWPRRSRCGSCGRSHVLLPVFALLRRADVVTVIGAALAAKAAGAGVRTVAAVVGRPVDTVRGWLRCFAGRAEAVRVVFTALLVEVGVDPVVPAVTRSVFADAVAAIAGGVRRCGRGGRVLARTLAGCLRGCSRSRCRVAVFWHRAGHDRLATRVASPAQGSWSGSFRRSVYSGPKGGVGD